MRRACAERGGLPDINNTHNKQRARVRVCVCRCVRVWRVMDSRLILPLFPESRLALPESSAALIPPRFRLLLRRSESCVPFFIFLPRGSVLAVVEPLLLRALPDKFRHCSAHILVVRRGPVWRRGL